MDSGNKIYLNAIYECGNDVGVGLGTCDCRYLCLYSTMYTCNEVLIVVFWDPDCGIQGLYDHDRIILELVIMLFQDCKIPGS